MGIGDLSHEQKQRSSDNGPSISYLYMYEEGREDIEEWPEHKKKVMAEAYQLASAGGLVRNTFKNTAEYRNIHDAVAHLIVAMGRVFEDGDFSDVLEFVGPDAEALAEYLDEHDDIREELSQRWQETQA